MITLDYARQKLWSASVHLLGDGSVRERLIDTFAYNGLAEALEITGLPEDLQERATNLREALLTGGGFHAAINEAPDEQVLEWAREVMNLAVLVSELLGQSRPGYAG